MKLDRYSAVTMLIVTVAWSAAACLDGPAGPAQVPAVVVETPSQWSGGSVRLSSASFETTPDVTVAIGDTVVEARPLSFGTVEFTLPALLTGSHEAVVRVDGGPGKSVYIDVVGLARSPTFFAGGQQSAGVLDAYPTPLGNVLVAERFRGYGIANLIGGGLVVPIPGLEETGDNETKMLVPGPSFRPNHYVFDLSPENSFSARVWQLWPSVAPVASLACGSADHGGFYTMAEVSEVDCLEVRRAQIVRNGTQVVWEHDRSLFAQFRMSPGGSWTVPIIRPLSQTDGIATWPVFGPDARVAYTVDRYDVVSGAAFSSTGNAMYVSARSRDEGGIWRIDELDPATGEVRQSLELPDVPFLLDVLVDDLSSRLYTVSSGRDGSPILHVIDRESLDLIASVPAPDFRSCRFITRTGVLTPGGSANQVHLANVEGTDCGLSNWTFDLR